MDSDHLYVLRGNGTTNTYRHTVSVTSSAWDSYAALPASTGNGAYIIKDDSYLYVLRGNNSTNTYRHTLDNTSSPWETFAALPGTLGVNGKVIIINNYLYVNQDSNYTGFYRHTVDNTSSPWEVLAPVPFGLATPNKGDMIVDPMNNNKIYFIPGNNTDNFYRYLVNQVTYLSSGTFTSAAIALGATSLTSLNWTSATPVGAGADSLRLQIATSSDNSTWSSFVGQDGTTGTYFTSSPATLSGVLTGPAKYLKYKAYLATTNAEFTPALYDFTVNYHGYATTGTVVSSIYDTGDPINLFGNYQISSKNRRVDLEYRQRAVYRS